MFIYRKDIKNCGDYWCSPQLYFEEYKAYDSFDILDIDENFKFQNFIIIGGGGLGKKLFQEKIKIISKSKENKKIICWGVGFNEIDFLKNNKLISEIALAKIVNINHFKDFDLQGIRDHGLPFDYHWVPCVSCLHPLFRKLKNNFSKKKIGIFYHHKMELKISGINPEDSISNYGVDLETKLNFLSNYEFIITNSYHGLYWAHLLNKKVLCFPVKSSLLNFPNKPKFINNIINKNSLDDCNNYPDFLDECIEANLNFKNKVKMLIGI